MSARERAKVGITAAEYTGTRPARQKVSTFPAIPGINGRRGSRAERLTHETSRVGFIGPDLSINLDDPLRHDGGDFSAGQGVLQSVSQEDGQGQAFSELVGTGGRSRGLKSEGLMAAVRERWK